MRQIKFRAWSKKYKEYISIGFSVLGETTAFNLIELWYIEEKGVSEGILDLMFNDVVLEEFTGLKDKNRKEIYEGDKFEGEEGNEYYVVEYNSNYARFEVSYYGYNMFHNEGGGEEFSSEISRIDCNCLDMDSLSSIEVIGNINEV